MVGCSHRRGDLQSTMQYQTLRVSGFELDINAWSRWRLSECPDADTERQSTQHRLALYFASCLKGNRNVATVGDGI